MQQRQLRLGDILDDYCPRERRVTNHVVVAMVGDDVKQTRCSTCDTEHEYKHAKIPRQRRKAETPALYAQVLAGGPKRVAHEPPRDGAPATTEDQTDAQVAEELVSAPQEEITDDRTSGDEQLSAADEESTPDAAITPEEDAPDEERDDEEGPVHRPLIRASLPRHDGQAPPSRPIPEFTIRQPAGRPNRFRPRGAGGGGGGQFQGGGNRSNGNMGGGGQSRGGGMRSSGRPQQGGGGAGGGPRRQGPPGRRRSK
jgi:hypothetical protein